MSQWVHVAAIARIDYLPDIFEGGDLNFDEVFGKECSWDDPAAVWDDAVNNEDKYLPMGSEGSLHKSVWVNPHRNHADQYTVSIFGDIRDVSSGGWIIEWFKNKLNGLFVRNATITVDTERGTPSTWTYGDSEESNTMIM